MATDEERVQALRDTLAGWRKSKFHDSVSMLAEMIVEKVVCKFDGHNPMPPTKRGHLPRCSRCNRIVTGVSEVGK